MSSPIAMPLEAQASALVSFLAQAQQTLATSAALEICGGMRAAKLPPARFLKAALAEQNIELKHTSCLKAVALMDGFAGHASLARGSRRVPGEPRSGTSNNVALAGRNGDVRAPRRGRANIRGVTLATAPRSLPRLLRHVDDHRRRLQI